MTDFFDRQERARRRTAWFLLLFALTLLALTAAIYFGALFIGNLFTQVPLWSPQIFWWTAGSLGVIVGTGTGVRFAQLREGGPAVAELLGGTPIDPDGDSRHRRLDNVVDEMAIASGIPKPLVYVLPRERGINAFAAGYGLHDAVIGVTAGTLAHLSRDELQGVIAHEFSHLLNGDTRLNTFMLGVLNGLVAIYETGQLILREVWGFSKHGTGLEVTLPGLLAGFVGMVLMIIGWVGVLSSRLLQCAVSRQREYLADAAAVQFTRHPAGLAGALIKVGGWSRHGLLHTHHAEEAGHVFFADAVSGTVALLLATHPPLKKRIRLLRPDFDGHFPVLLDERAAARNPIPREPAPGVFPDPPARDPFLAAGRATAPIWLIGQLVAENLGRSRQLLESLPADLREAVHHPAGAQAVVFGLLGGDAGGEWRGALPDGVAREFQRLRGSFRDLPPQARLALLDLALPRLLQLSREQMNLFLHYLESWSGCAAGRDMETFCLVQTVRHHLAIRLDRASWARPRIQSLGQVWDSLHRLFSALAHAADQDTELAWEELKKRLPPVFHRHRLLPPEKCQPEVLAGDLKEISRSTPHLMRSILEAASAAVAADGVTSPREAGLLRAFAAALGCPVPPLCGEQDSEEGKFAQGA